jgi:hypothetical protein
MSAETVHFQCVFDLTPRPGASWADIPKQIRGWIGTKTEDLGLATRWFLEGGQTQTRSKARQAVVTRREIGSGSENAPEFWAVCYEHPCSEVKFRQWRTEIGLTALGEGRIRFSLRNSHWLRPDYIGAEPKDPLPSAPGIVGRLLRAGGWQAWAGSERLSDSPARLDAGTGAGFAQRLADPDRLCPVVLVTRTFSGEATLVDAGRLARLLAGVAKVVEAGSAEVNRELEWVLAKGFRCWDGMVRVYQPRVRFDHEGDARRHRYFGAQDVARLGAAGVEEMLIVGIARRSGLSDVDALTTLDDVDTRQRERRLADLRATAKDAAELREFMDLYDAENRGLITKLAAAQAEAREARETTEKVRDDAGSLEHERDNLRGERDYWKDLALKADQKIKRLEDAAGRLGCLTKMPSSLPEAIGIVEALHGASVAFTDRAKNSAEKAMANRSQGDLREAWSCLWATALHLPRILFRDQAGNPEQAFRDATGLELAMSEGKLTQRDKGLMRLRRDSFEGREIDITPHVKSGPTFRLYFAVDAAQKRIIVGHCGDHLDTAGTRRMD